MAWPALCSGRVWALSSAGGSISKIVGVEQKMEGQSKVAFLFPSSFPPLVLSAPDLQSLTFYFGETPLFLMGDKRDFERADHRGMHHPKKQYSNKKSEQRVFRGETRRVFVVVVEVAIADQFKFHAIPPPTPTQKSHWQSI
ncbi:hypothetical protein DdX_02787 [Ditylenchus destructor]|uniref:Uncharacterized protein n=1 Tax=Ditylenchus destructor TaxID=166010 RepID=A0AAD4RCH6_9BILA|nr:hypothetical protein DdX_02787 [Ditylenchus destructor]